MPARKFQSPGLRRSQAITTFGPGSIVDLRFSSVMMAGLDFWPDKHAIITHEPNLERILHVDEFRIPSTRDISGGRDLPAVIFPRWQVCPKCDRLAEWDTFALGLHQPGRALKCPDCNIRVYPARLIVACRHGHIDDFPWIGWVHNRSNLPICERPTLFLKARGFSSSLADLQLSCKGPDCDASTNMGGATEERNFKAYRCEGNRPWLKDSEDCGDPIKPLQRGASNVYFSVQASSISIPPWSKGVYSQLDRHWAVFKNAPDHILKDLVNSMNLPEILGTDSAEIIDAIRFRKSQDSGDLEDLSERDLRYMECKALRQPNPEYDPASEFKTSEAPVHPDLSDWISRVILVERLREVRALLGFTRIEPPDPSDRLTSRRVPISRRRLNWAPAVEVRGEGIYLELDEGALLSWLESWGRIVSKRAGHLHSTYVEICKRRDWQILREITPRLLLVHSFAHLLIRQLALESGYSAASLRERLYVFEPSEMDDDSSGIAGLLIYTSTPDSEGSLGGLVRQGHPDRLFRTVMGALRESSWCASDPLCIESEGQGPDSTNLAACHACMLISETSCEEFNRFLDRGMLSSTLEEQDSGFFSSLSGD